MVSCMIKPEKVNKDKNKEKNEEEYKEEYEEESEDELEDVAFAENKIKFGFARGVEEDEEIPAIEETLKLTWTQLVSDKLGANVYIRDDGKLLLLCNIKKSLFSQEKNWVVASLT